MDDGTAEGDLNCVDLLAQGASEENDFVMWTRDCSYDNLVNNVAVFCYCTKSLPEAKVKRFRLIALTKVVSKQPGLDSVVWFLNFTFRKSLLMNRSKLQKEKYKTYG